MHEAAEKQVNRLEQAVALAACDNSNAPTGPPATQNATDVTLPGVASVLRFTANPLTKSVSLMR